MTVMIETERLVLRLWREDDAADLFRYASDIRVSAPALWPRHESIEMSRMVIRDYFMAADLCLAMRLKDSGEVVGCIGLVPAGDEHYPTLPAEREVGYWIGHPYWHKGLTTEALQALIDYCRRQLALQSLLLTTAESNIGSQRVAEKCGFTLITRYRHEDIPSRAYRLSLCCR